MTIPKTKCNTCGFEDDHTNQPTGICQSCAVHKLEILTIQINVLAEYAARLSEATEKIIPKKGYDVHDVYFDLVNELRVKAGKEPMIHRIRKRSIKIEKNRKGGLTTEQRRYLG